jgi:hypothetical protein
VDGNNPSELTVQLPDDLAHSVRLLRTATGRDDFDIVTSALRTYLADQIQRDTVRSYFDVVPDVYPRAYFVTIAASLDGAARLDELDRAGVERTFAQINRFATTDVRWGPGQASVTIGMGVSGYSAAEAAEMAAKMVRNRLVDEHSLALGGHEGGLSVVTVVELTDSSSPELR